MQSTNPNQFDQIIELPEIVVHGSKERAAQSGYTNMTVGIDTDAQAIIEKAYGTTVSGHGHGNPGFCMYLKLGNFYRYVDGQAGFTIMDCHMCQFPNNNATSGGWPGVANDYGAGAAVVGGTPFDNTPFNYRRFPCPFDITAALISEDGNVLMSVPLLHKDKNPSYWTSNQITMGSSKVISGQYGLSKDKKLVVAVLMKSTCSCDQNKRLRPVFATDISTYIPPARRYVWRRFGNLAQEQAIAQQHGYTLSDEWKKNCDGQWHLVRPFYYNKNGKWTNVEDIDKM